VATKKGKRNETKKILYKSERSTREIMEGRKSVSETEGSGQKKEMG
jgi:hypothetical protein